MNTKTLKSSEVTLKPIIECSCGKLHDVYNLPPFIGPENLGLLIFNCECGSTVSIYSKQYSDIILGNSWNKDYSDSVEQDEDQDRADRFKDMIGSVLGRLSR